METWIPWRNTSAVSTDLNVCVTMYFFITEKACLSITRGTFKEWSNLANGMPWNFKSIWPKELNPSISLHNPHPTPAPPPPPPPILETLSSLVQWTFTAELFSPFRSWLLSTQPKCHLLRGFISGLHWINHWKTNIEAVPTSFPGSLFFLPWNKVKHYLC